MAHEVGEIVAKLQQLQESIAALERRVTRVESELHIAGTSQPAIADEPPLEEFDVASLLSATLLGRTLLVLGGAYFIRALTEADVLAPGAGVLLAILYALGWVALADRAVAKGKRASGLFHVVATAAIAFPLIWESATRFDVLSPELAALLLAVVSAAILAVAWRHDLVGAAWIGVLGASGTATALLFATRAFEPTALLLVILGSAVYWLCRTRSWPGLTGWSAFAADFGVFMLGTGALTGGLDIDLRRTIVIQLLLFVFYVSSFLLASLKLHRRSGLFEALQLLLVTVLGFGGATRVAIHLGGGAVPGVAVASLVGALAGYIALLSHRAWVDRHPRSFFFFATLVWVVAAVGGGLRFEPAAPAWALFAVLAALMASRIAGATLCLQATAYLILAAESAGLFTETIRDYFAPATTVLTSGHSAAHWTVLVAALICAALPVADEPAPWHSWVPYARATLLAVLLLAVGPLLVSLLLPLTMVGETVDAGRLATLRTALLALIAVLAAAGSRLERLRPAAWLVYPLLLLGGLKLILEDFPHSRPGHLVIALAVYAGALIVAPRLRMTAAAASERDGSPTSNEPTT